MKEKRYTLFQGLNRLTKKHTKISEQMRGLLNMRFYTEGEMLETMLAEADEGTFFKCDYCGFDFDKPELSQKSYSVMLKCDDYLADDKVDTEKLRQAFYKQKEICINNKSKD